MNKISCCVSYVAILNCMKQNENIRVRVSFSKIPSMDSIVNQVKEVSLKFQLRLINVTCTELYHSRQAAEVLFFRSLNLFVILRKILV